MTYIILKNFTTKTEPQAKGEQQQLEVSDVKQELVTTRSTKLDEAPLTAEINLTSQMATPMHYFSRSSSMTSLNSFDVKSIHSEVASEYSQVTSQVTSPSYKHRRGKYKIIYLFQLVRMYQSFHTQLFLRVTIHLFFIMFDII